MKISGIVRVDRRTKDLVKRLQPGDIALINHEDLDLVAADSLAAARVKAVLNCSKSISGRYVNRGPFVLLDAGIPLIDQLDESLMDRIAEGDTVEVEDGAVFHAGKRVSGGVQQTPESLDESCRRARENLEDEIDKFADNTLQYIKKEKYLLYGELKAEGLKADFRGRQVLVVVRGMDYKKDLEALGQYIREKRPFLLAVDGGADALMEFGFKPDMILGDMDSVSDRALRSGASLVVHAYREGKAPGQERIRNLGLSHHLMPAAGTSEDLALQLAFERGAELIVIVGSHFSMDEFLMKGRGGMASTFLTRLKVGSILVDAKGVSKLYENRVAPILLLYIVLAAIFPILAIFGTSPLSRQFLRLFRLMLKI